MNTTRSILRREYGGVADWATMAQLARLQPANNLHIIDLPYRFSSWAFDAPDNIAIWERDGEMLGWAALQTPFWTIDLVVHPDAPPTLYRDMLTWVDARAQGIADTPQGRPCWFVNPFAEQTEIMADLSAQGFADVGDWPVDAWTKVLLMRPCSEPVTPAIKLPDGFVIRPLAGEADVDGYVAAHRAAFDSTSMTREWRARTLQQPDYVPALDLVAVAPSGEIAAFCIGWFSEDIGGEPVGQIEPLGVAPAYQGIGLGRNILAEQLRRQAAHGAARVWVETDNYREAAVGLYGSAGLRVIRNVRVFRKDYAG
jgi:mycothiol synthase